MRPRAAKPNKPPYRVPSMAEIRAVPWNGFSAISTFSGCGGSCLGYRMAGFRVLWASEFIPAAQETYRANHPETLLDVRDIRLVKGAEILVAIGMRAGELDLMDGSPPCASFSTAGKREDGWGLVKPYSDTKQRTDDLFFEYARLVKDLQPRVFVAENVSGLVKGVAKGYFLEILAALKAAGYRVSARVLDAQWLGVPQMRQRAIFMGVRADLGLEPAYPSPLPYRYTVREAIPWVVRHSIKPTGTYNPQFVDSGEVPSGAVLAGDGGKSTCPGGSAFVEVKRTPVRVIHDTSGQFSQGDVTDRPCPAITVGPNGMNSRHYQVEERVVEPETDVSRFAIGRELDKLCPGEQSGRYFSLVRAPLDGPSPTVTTATGGAAGVAHPTERRKFSIEELKRICAFPDDFVLTGTYQQQWERLGRAVPPVMMWRVACEVRDRILKPCAESRAAS